VSCQPPRWLFPIRQSACPFRGAQQAAEIAHQQPVKANAVALRKPEKLVFASERLGDTSKSQFHLSRIAAAFLADKPDPVADLWGCL
jgi:hypothetical protein